MDINDLRAALTVASFLTFVGIMVWAYLPGRKRSFDQAARSVLEEDSAEGAARRPQTGRGETK